MLSLTSILCKAYAESTELAYVGRLRDFAQFSIQHVPPLPGLPCQKQHVHLYLLHLAQRGSFGADGMGQVVSAINSVHRLLGFPVPIVDDGQHKLFMSGLGKTLLPLQAKAVKRPLLVSFLELAIDVALTRIGCDPIFVVVIRSSSAMLLRCVWGTLVAFRGSTVAAMEVPDLVVTPTSFRVAARVIKARGVLATTLSDWEFYFQGHPKLKKLIDVYMLARRAVSVEGSLWRWPPLDVSRAKLTESVVDDWVIDLSAAGGAGHGARHLQFSLNACGLCIGFECHWRES
jgi:hypothetical protein